MEHNGFLLTKSISLVIVEITVSAMWPMYTIAGHVEMRSAYVERGRCHWEIQAMI